MKPLALIISGSVTLNVALAVGWIRADSISDFSNIRSSEKTNIEITEKSTALRGALASSDFAALCAAGVPVDRARDLSLGFAYARYREKLRGAQPLPETDPRYWRKAYRSSPSYTAEQRTLIAQAERELAATLTALLGEDASLVSPGDPRLAFLPAWKRAEVQRIEQDYTARREQLHDDARGLALPSDREAEQQLKAAKERDLAALLTPEERDALELRASHLAINLMDRYGDGLESEGDWRTVLLAYKAHDEKFGSVLSFFPPDLDAVRAGNEDTRKMFDELRQSLGEERFAALQRSVDSDRPDLASLTRRLNLPADTTDRVIALRDAYAAESQRVANDPALERVQKTTAITALAAKARDELASILGTEATDAYARRPNWLRGLSQGIAQNTQATDEYFGSSSLKFYRGSPGRSP